MEIDKRETNRQTIRPIQMGRKREDSSNGLWILILMDTDENRQKKRQIDRQFGLSALTDRRIRLDREIYRTKKLMEMDKKRQEYRQTNRSINTDRSTDRQNTV